MTTSSVYSPAATSPATNLTAFWPRPAAEFREDLRVSDVMTLRPELELLSMEDIQRARVGDLIATLRQVDRQHALVLDRDPETGKPAVRGIFSLSQISLRLGLNIDPSRQVTLYADFEKAGGTL